MIETSLETYWEVHSFLMREAELLDRASRAGVAGVVHRR